MRVTIDTTALDELVADLEALRDEAFDLEPEAAEVKRAVANHNRAQFATGGAHGGKPWKARKRDTGRPLLVSPKKTLRNEAVRPSSRGLSVRYAKSKKRFTLRLARRSARYQARAGRAILTFTQSQATRLFADAIDRRLATARLKGFTP
jgi:hypothetical protein